MLSSNNTSTDTRAGLMYLAKHALSNLNEEESWMQLRFIISNADHLEIKDRRALCAQAAALLPKSKKAQGRLLLAIFGLSIQV